MVDLVLLRNGQKNLLPTGLLSLCTGCNILTLPPNTLPKQEQLVLVDFADVEASLAYMRQLRGQERCCFFLLVAPLEQLPPFTELAPLGIAAYVPAPVQVAQFTNAIQQAITQIHALRNRYIPRSDYAQLRQSMELLQVSTLYRHATSGNYHPPESLAQFNALYGSQFTQCSFGCFGIQVDHLLEPVPGRKPTWPYLREDITDFFAQRGIYAILMQLDSFLGVLFTPDDTPPRLLAAELLEQLRQAALPQDHITIGYACPQEGLENIPTLLMDAVDGLRNRITLGVDRVICSADHSFALADAALYFPYERRMTLSAQVKLGDLDAAHGQIQELVEGMQQTPPLPARTILYTAICIYEVLREDTEAPPYQNFFHTTDAGFFHDLDCCYSMECLSKILLGWSRQFVQQSQSLAPPADRIRRSLRYINEHLQEPLCLRDIALAAQVSPSYYSTLFKAQTGITFSEYIQTQRISAASALLSDTQLSIAEIASQVGFPDYRYFTRLFSRSTGMTPTHYRKHTRRRH